MTLNKPIESLSVLELYHITRRGLFSQLMKACLLECSTHALCESVFWCQAVLLYASPAS